MEATTMTQNGSSTTPELLRAETEITLTFSDGSEAIYYPLSEEVWPTALTVRTTAEVLLDDAT